MKRTAQGFLANSLQGRVEYHLTRYGPGVSHMMTRGWITLDQREILSCSTIQLIRHYQAVKPDGWPNEASEFDELHNLSLFTRQEYVDALDAYVASDIGDALASSDPLIRAFAIFDCRVGKRRLATLEQREDPSPVVRHFYRIRCEADRNRRVSFESGSDQNAV